MGCTGGQVKQREWGKQRRRGKGEGWSKWGGAASRNGGAKPRKLHKQRRRGKAEEAKHTSSPRDPSEFRPSGMDYRRRF